MRRVIHSPKAGLFTAKRHIGDSVQANEVIGYVDKEPVRAKLQVFLEVFLRADSSYPTILSWPM